jgi:hypothetical protein
VKVRGAKELAENLRAMRREAALYKQLATLRTDVPLHETARDLAWRGPNVGALGALGLDLPIV